MTRIHFQYGEARHFYVGDVLRVSDTLLAKNRGDGVIVRVTDDYVVDTLPATWRRRFAAWVWRNWGRR